MNKTVIELKAINALERELNRTNRIEPDINKNDKTPSWDGEIRYYIKGCEYFSKENLINCVPIQVKGTYCDTFSNGVVSYQIDVRDLFNYKKSNGVVFFLIQIKSDDKYRIFYKSLLPFELRRILEGIGSDQKTKTIKLSRFPQRHVEGISNVFNDFIINRSKQGKLLPELTSISDAKKIDVEKFEFSIPNENIYSTEDAIDYILSNPIYIYAKPKGISESFATDIITTSIVSGKFNLPVIVNNEKLFDSYQVQKAKKKEPIICLGENIIIRFEKKRTELVVKDKGNIIELIKGYKFYLAVANNDDVYIGDKKFEIPNVIVEEKNIEQTKGNLKTLNSIKKALDKLNVKKELNITNVDNSEVIKLAHIAKSINEGCPVPICSEQDSFANVFSIGNISILIKVVGSEIKNNNYILDFFKCKDVKLYLEDGNKEFLVSPYVVVDKTIIANSDNFHLSDIVESIKQFDLNEFYAEKINDFALILLQLYDESFFKSKDVLFVVLELYKYLESYDEKSDIYHINRIQTQVRIGGISDCDKEYLINLKSLKLSSDFKVAANVLLESFIEAEYEYEKMTNNDKKRFDNFPISNLWKRE